MEAKMLFYLVNTRNDDQFKTIYHEIERAFWPENDYIDHVNSGQDPELPTWRVSPPATERSEKIAESLKEILKIVAKTPLYARFSRTGIQPDASLTEHHHLPFVDRYHTYFAIRQWTTPLRNPRDDFKELFWLKQPDQNANENEKANYAKNKGDYYHFLNVVAATARLIDYFSSSTNTENILKKTSHDQDDNPPNMALFAGTLSIDKQSCVFEGKVNHSTTSLAQTFSFGTAPDKRTFKLLLAAFYHDLGKTVENHRHGMEGASILADHTSTALLHLGGIVKGYGVDWSFDRDDLLHVATMVYYHDQFGTLSTGEAGYLRLVDIVDRFKRSSTTEGYGNRQEQIKLSMRHLFDLWVLNVADIMVSVTDKWIPQEVWMYRDQANKRIEDFFTLNAKPLKHDLYIALNLLDEHNKKWHSDNLAHLQKLASEYANMHVVERISRLIDASLVQLLSPKKVVQRASEYPSCRIKQVLEELVNLSPQVRETIILRCIQSVSNFAEFSSRFAWIGQMDYALGFFRKIADHALECVAKQLCEDGPPTGWINNTVMDEADKERRNIMDAEFLTDNFASTVVQILEYLLFREQSIKHLRNIEFEDASKRLKREKIDKIIGLEGPYRARRSIEFILQTIFVY